MESIEMLSLALQVAKAEHRHGAEQIASFNMPTVTNLSRVDFSKVLSSQLSSPERSTASLVTEFSHAVERERLSIDQLTADVLDASGKYKVLTEIINRQLGLMSIAVTGQRR